MKKRILLRLFFTFTIFTTLVTSQVLADDIDNSDEIIDITKEVSAPSTKELNINSRSYIVLDRKTNEVLFGKNQFEKRKMASTTKIMTALITLERVNLQDNVTVSKKAARTSGSRLGLKANDIITVNDLLYGLMLCSGNDAAVCLAEYVGGSIEEFAELMNQKAKELNLTNTHFVTPHGLDSEEHYTTSYELAILSNYALNNTKFKEIVGTKNHTININGYPKALSNTNELLGNLSGVYGIKTGFTNGANRCLVTACKRNDMDIICVVLGADTKKFRTQDSIKLIEYTFENYQYIDVKLLIESKFQEWKQENLGKISINKSISSNIDVHYSPIPYNSFPIFKEDISSLKVNIDCKYELNAPIMKDSSIGTLKLSLNDKDIVTCDLLVSNSVDKKNISYYLGYFYKNYISLLSSIFNNN